MRGADLKEQIKKLLPKNRFARSVSILAGGTAAGQAVVVLASPLLTRLYSPEDFGLLAVYASLLGIIGVVASLRYQLAIPLPEKDEEAAHVVVLSLLVVLGMTLLTILVVVFFRDPIAQAVNMPVLANYLWLLPLGLLLTGIYDIFNYWAIRIKAFPAIARTKFAQSLSMIGVQLGGFMLGPLALILGHVSGQAAGNTSLGMLAIRNRWSLFSRVSLKNVILAARRYRRFPIYSTWGGAFNTAGTQLPPLLFAALFSASAAGLYMLAHRVLSLPTALLGNSIADVFLSSAADARRNNNLGELVNKLHSTLAKLAMPPALILFITGPELFSLIFGPDWHKAGEVARWLAPMLYIKFIVSPLSRIFIVLEQLALNMFLQGVLLGSRVLSLVIIYILNGSFIEGVILYGAVSFLSYTLFLISITLLTKDHIKNFILPSLKIIPVSLFIIMPILLYMLLDPTDSHNFWLTFATSVLLTILFYIYSFKCYIK